MRLFKPTKAVSVYVPEIDQEHRNICRANDELQQAIATQAPQAQVLEALHRLIGASDAHFAHEEALMRTYHYSPFEWHRQQHETVRKRLRQFVPRIEAGECEAAGLLTEFLNGWIKDHTGLADRMMGAYIRNQRRFLAA
jgi:hemerythrin-like metal-binding protein